MVQNGSTGSVNTLFLRGGESRYTKVLVDGVAVNAPGGFFDFSHLTTDNVERIEIVRGPASVVARGRRSLGHHPDLHATGTRSVQSFRRMRGRAIYGSREANCRDQRSRRPLRFALGGGTHHTDGTLPFNNNYYNGTLSGSLGMTPRKGTDALRLGSLHECRIPLSDRFHGRAGRLECVSRSAQAYGRRRHKVAIDGDGNCAGTPWN